MSTKLNHENKMSDSRYRHIVVEGPIGVGKTSLARRLAQHFGAGLLLEAPDANPFLERFYRDSARYALPTQLFFLFQRVDQLRELNRDDPAGRAVITDFLLDKDALFAALTLNNDELALYRQMAASLAPQTQSPDLVIYLQASPDTLVDRITRRGKPMEAAISDAYLRELCEAYTRFFYQYNAAPLLMVNTEHLNLVDEEQDFALLLERIGQMRGQREYFNRAD